MSEYLRGIDKAITTIENKIRDTIKAEFGIAESSAKGWNKVDYDNFYSNPCLLAIMSPYETGYAPEKIEIEESKIEQPYLAVATPPIYPGTLIKSAKKGDRYVLVPDGESFSQSQSVILSDNKGKYEIHPVVSVSKNSVVFEDEIKNEYTTENEAIITPATNLIRFSIPRIKRPDFSQVFLSGAWDAVSKNFTPWIQKQWVCVNYLCYGYDLLQCGLFPCWHWCKSCDWVYVPYNWIQQQIIKAIVIMAWFSGSVFNRLWDNAYQKSLGRVEQILNQINYNLYDVVMNTNLKIMEFCRNLKNALDMMANNFNAVITRFRDDLKKSFKELTNNINKGNEAIINQSINKIYELVRLSRGMGFAPAIVRNAENGFEWWSPASGVKLYYVVFQTTL